MVSSGLNSVFGGDEGGFYLRSRQFRGGSEDVEAFEVVGQADQGPFQSGFLVTSHGKAPKTHGGFDDSDDGFNRLFS